MSLIWSSWLTFILMSLVVFGLRAQPSTVAGQSSVTFEEVPAKVSGILWVHDNAMSPERHLPETSGAGCAFFDFDNDGWMDVYLVNSGSSDFFTPKTPLKNALYRNNRDGTFSDLTGQAGVSGGQFGMGVTIGDYNGDGWQDIYVTNYGKNLLYRNNSNGTFTDVAQQAGVDTIGWSTSAVWFDYDNDGKLDLFVSSFAEYNKSMTALCADETSRPHYCIPRLFKPTPSHLFHNSSDGTFADVSRESGIAGSLGKAFGVVATDVNNDDLMDLFVANDTVANFLFQNLGKGKFEEIGLFSGVAYSEAGTPRSGMGVDAADYNGDGWQDLFVANVDHQSFSLYHNQKDLTFDDQAAEIGRATRMLSGWGLRFFDYDNDGDQDLFLANGHPDDMVEQHMKEVTYKEPLLLFQNHEGVFNNVSARSGSIFSRHFPARGLATGDFDNDGDIDVLVSNNGEAPLLLRNVGGNSNHWLGLQLVATQSNPAAAGTRITWEAGGTRRSRLKTGGGSYLSSHDSREILGLGNAARIDLLEIRWPSGRVDKVANLLTDTYIKVVEGQGAVEKR